MSSADQPSFDQQQPRAGWLPSPGCLFAGTLLVVVATAGFWIARRHNQQTTQLRYFERVARDVETAPAAPEWLHDLVVPRLSEDEADSFTNVTHIDLRGTQITDAGLQHLRGLVNLRDLRLRDTPVTDAGLQHLRGLTSLEELSLSDTQVTDAGLQHLAHLASLRKLYLRNTAITDAGLEHLSGLTSLQWLFLENTRVTDDGLHHLHGLTSLKWVDLGGTPVTEGGADALRSELPGVEVVR